MFPVLAVLDISPVGSVVSPSGNWYGYNSYVLPE